MSKSLDGGRVVEEAVSVEGDVDPREGVRRPVRRVWQEQPRGQRGGGDHDRQWTSSGRAEVRGNGDGAHAAPPAAVFRLGGGRHGRMWVRSAAVCVSGRGSGGGHCGGGRAGVAVESGGAAGRGRPGARDGGGAVEGPGGSGGVRARGGGCGGGREVGRGGREWSGVWAEGGVVDGGWGHFPLSGGPPEAVPKGGGAGREGPAGPERRRAGASRGGSCADGKEGRRARVTVSPRQGPAAGPVGAAQRPRQASRRTGVQQNVLQPPSRADRVPPAWPRQGEDASA
ncbi:unnamed protein product [Pleuronectes platessa]|uniref:Uncharacterized protein n=1 Tax=Pleuronectes platessa TaxID=8262 RepID=A0A9N7Z8U7_PLEPL|nr:unnamed protein product [Pleuronectes platessa]